MTKHNNETDEAECVVCDLLYLGILGVLELILWWKLGITVWLLAYGFVCALRGGQLARMRRDGTWKRIREKLRLSQSEPSNPRYHLNQKTVMPTT